MIRKTYRSIVYKDLDTYMMVKQPDGSKLKTLIQFRGGSLQPVVNGIFSTDNPNVIEAMDHDSSLGISFKCVRVEGEEPVKKAEPAEETKQKAESKEAPKNTNQEQSDLKDIPGIATLQEARNYLLVNFPELKPSQVNTSAQVRTQAVKNGLQFPDFK